ncbi:thiol-disulfide oxidoreductase DCC family protein [Arenimonas sp. MALMAid1274]|uniref:thiol-disulfide oxidoreductase DCC family protein n=1 Tax=Arenimonas sp. MALMAid1274 TaxID=3411630 RepID=UPI003BA0C07D
MSTTAWPLVIYYDASCPLCREEMHALKDFDAHSLLELRDASAAGFTDPQLSQAGIAQADLMRLIHARDSAGQWYRGVEVFERAYRAAGLEAVAAVWAQPRLRPVWDRLYPWVARFRQPLSRLHLNRLYGWLVRRAARRAQEKSRACAEGRCELPPPLP